LLTLHNALLAELTVNNVWWECWRV